MNNRTAKIMNLLMLSCEKATLLISVKSFRKLSVTENVQLCLHLKSCSACRHFKKQNNIIDLGIKSLLTANEKHLPHLSDSKKEEIKTLINQQDKTQTK